MVLERPGGVDEAIQQAEGDPVRQLVAVVGAVARQGSDAGHRGFPFLNTHAEFRDPDHPAHRVSVEHFDALRRQLQDLATRPPATSARRGRDGSC